MSLACGQPSYASIFERLVAEAKAPKSTTPPTKLGSFKKLAFIQEKILNTKGSKGNDDVEPPNYLRAPT